MHRWNNFQPSFLALALLGAWSLPTQPASCGEAQAESRLSRKPPSQRPVTGKDEVRIGELETLIAELRGQDRYAEAIAPAEEVVAIRARVQGEDHWGTVNSSWVVETLKRVAQLSDDDRALFEEVEKADAALWALRGEGKTYEALQLVQRQVSIRTRLLGGRHPATLISMSCLASLLQETGNYAAAEALHRGVLTAARQVLGDEHPDVTVFMNSLGSFLLRRSDYTAAEPLFREAVAIQRRILGDEHWFVAVALGNLAQSLQVKGDYAEAEKCLRDSLAIRRATFGDTTWKVAQCLHNLAGLQQERGDYDGAEQLLRDSLAIKRRRLGNEHPSVAAGLVSLGALTSARGKYIEAEALFGEALAILSEDRDDQRLRAAAAMGGLASLFHSTGRYAEAEREWSRAAEIFEAVRRSVSAGGLDRIHFSASRSPLVPLAACRARNGKAISAWRSLEGDLARGLLDTLWARQTSHLSLQERDRRAHLLGQLNGLYERISLLSDPSGGDEASAVARKLRRELGELQAELAEFEHASITKYGLVAGEVLDLPRIQAELSTDSALLSWVDVKGEPNAVDPGGEHWACVLRHEGEPVWLRLPGTGKRGAWTEEDDNLAESARQELSTRPNGDSAKAVNLLRQLHAQRIAPARSHLAGVRRLIILPAGWMAGVPIEALTDEYTISYAPSGTIYAWLQEKAEYRKQRGGAGGKLLALGDPVFQQPKGPGKPTPVLPDHGVHLAMVTPDSNAASSGLLRGDVLLTYDGRKLSNPEDLGSVILHTRGEEATTRGEAGIPVTAWRSGQTLEITVAPGKLGVRPSTRPAREAVQAERQLDTVLANARGPSFAPLPGTRSEVQAVAKLFEPAKEQAGATILFGADANEEELDSLARSGELKSFRFLHLATHGIMDDEVPMRSALILSQEPTDGANAVERIIAGKEVYDGRLTAEQIVRTWKLDADLVTLSACETALGKKSGGEGHLGFAQALFVSGARSLLLSLWKVDDTATALLMIRFYENLLGRFEKPRSLPDRFYAPGQSIPKAEALREAKLWLRGLTRQQAKSLCEAYDLDDPVARGTPGPMGGPKPPDHRFDHPYYWAAFILIGDPG